MPKIKYRGSYITTSIIMYYFALNYIVQLCDTLIVLYVVYGTK